MNTDKMMKMTKKRNLFGIVVTIIVSIGLLSGCGKQAVTEQKDEAVEVVEVAEVETPENKTIEEEIKSESTPFGLQDYEGLYCRTETEEIEDYEITYTYGYQLNGDGTGVSYGQDVVEFTWNETEIHFVDSTENFTMKPGKLTVRDLEYDKIKGNFITPNPCNVDVDNIVDGIYPVCIDESGISEADGKVIITAEIFTEDTYDIVDVNRMTEGDVVYINGRLFVVASVNQTEFGILEINGGIENGGSALRAVDESNCFVYEGMDSIGSYSRHGITSIAVNNDVKFIDKYDPSEEKEYTGSDTISALKEIVAEYPLTCYDCTIRVEDGEIVEITRIYRP